MESSKRGDLGDVVEDKNVKKSLTRKESREQVLKNYEKLCRGEVRALVSFFIEHYFVESLLYYIISLYLDVLSFFTLYFIVLY